MCLCEQVCVNPALVPVFSECLRLCGNWLAESCLEGPAVILEKYLERVKLSHIVQGMMGNKVISGKE